MPPFSCPGWRVSSPSRRWAAPTAAESDILRSFTETELAAAIKEKSWYAFTADGGQTLALAYVSKTVGIWAGLMDSERSLQFVRERADAFVRGGSPEELELKAMALGEIPDGWREALELLKREKREDKAEWD